ncbi:MAG: DUF1573 domain-containing protein [Planctomycetaceae bacterium]|nr:DUF1573 domain-containing protein [Planctomycetaceae bacterium]
MRPTSVIAGVLALFAALGVLAWAISPGPPAQAEPEATAEVEEPGPDGLAESAAPPKPRDKSDEVDSNPFELGSDGPHPRAVVDEEIHKFGQLAVRAVGKHDFVIRNDGEAPLRLAKGHTTCKCTGFELGVKEIAPGESAQIHLEWRPVEESEVFAQTATIWSNDPEHAEIKLQVEGQVVPLVKMSPGGLWPVGSITEGSPSTVRGYIASAVEPAFEITSVDVSTPHITVKHEPMDAEALQQEHVLSGYWLDCTVNPDISVGVFEETIKVNLTLTDAPTMQFVIQGNRVGPFQIIGPGWRQANQTLSMGRCKAADGKTIKVSLFVSHLPGATVEFGEPQVTPPILNVTVTHDETFKASDERDRYLVVLEAPAGTTPGRWATDTAIKVHLPCNHPDADGANISVEFQAD